MKKYPDAARPARARRHTDARLLRATLAACAAVALLMTALLHYAPAPEPAGSVAVAAVDGVPEHVGELELSGVQPYLDPENGYRIEFPAGWRVVAGPGSGSVQATRGDATIAVMVLDATTPEMEARVREDFLRRGIRLTSDEVRQTLRTELDFRSFADGAVTPFIGRRLEKIRTAAAGSRVLEQGVHRLGGRTAGYLRAVSGGSPPEEVASILYFTLSRGKYYHVSGGARADEFSAVAPLLEQAIRSFQLRD